MVSLSEPNSAAFLEALLEAPDKCGDVDAIQRHRTLQSMYSWDMVATRNEAVPQTSSIITLTHTPSHREEITQVLVLISFQVYDRIMGEGRPAGWYPQLARYETVGFWAGKIFVCVMVVHLLWLWLIQWWLPDEQLDHPPNWSDAVRRQRHGPDL